VYWDVEERNSTGGELGCGGEKKYRWCTGMCRGEGTRQAVYWDVDGKEQQDRQFTELWRRRIKKGSVLGCGGGGGT
jgi:hypothetical protein